MPNHTAYIFDYSNCIKDTRNTYMRSHEDDYGETRKPEHPELFFAKRGWCPFCSISVPVVHEVDYGYNTRDPFLHEWEKTVVWECPTCGWWGIVYDFRSIDDLIGDASNIVLYHGTLRQFDATDKQTPIKILRDAISKRCEYLYEIEPYRMEQLVKDVFSDFFKCEVKHCGRSGDGGVDLFVLESDNPIAVQVKRRSKQKSSEGIKTIREFLGVMCLRGLQRGAIVTTAHHFTKQARYDRSEALSKHLVTSFDLIDIDRFLHIFDLVRKDPQPGWIYHKPYKGSKGWPKPENTRPNPQTLGSLTNLDAIAWKLGIGPNTRREDTT